MDKSRILLRTFTASAVFLAMNFLGLAQDFQQAQFFALPVTANPAFAGHMEFDCKEMKSNLRGSWLSRRQWGSAFNSDGVIVELFRKKSRMGFAVQIQNQRVAGSKFSSTAGGLSVSHRLNIGSNWHISSGLQISLVQRGFAFSELRFTDQFTDQGYSPLTTSQQQILPADSRVYPDASAGLLGFNERFWAGMSVQQITRPSVSIIRSGERLPMKFTLQAGMKFPFRSSPNFGLFRRDVSLHPVWQWRISQPFSQMDAGFYYNHEPVMAGILYRGAVFGKTDADQRLTQDAVVFLMGIKQDGLRLGYSIELNLKRKTTGAFPTHELTMSYQYARKGCLRRKYGKWIPVPSI
jgi:type IX secretion system PorP/SprF family membrane protein